MSETKNNPLAVYCSSCGAPAEYDIIHQEYHCQYCGGTTDVHEPVKRLGEWRDARRKEILKDESVAEEKCVCQNCGAEIVIPEGEAMGSCEFCGGKFARRAFAASELPEVIIPFVLTEDEARARLTEWAEKNKGKKEAQRVLAEIKKLRGYYLPYELIRGPVIATVQRKETYSDRDYHVGGFLNGIAVNTSKQLDNLVLDAMEPFEWTAARTFEFAFVAGQRVKLSDIDANRTKARVLEEVEEGFRPDIEKALQTTGVDIFMQAGEILRLPALLPAYVLPMGKSLAVVNGQTGRVAVSREGKSRNISWLVEPTVTTLAVMLLTCLWQPVMALPMGLVFGLIFFTAFSEGRGDEWRRKIFKTEKSRADRVQSKLTVTQGADVIEDTATKAVFMEIVGGEPVPVKFSFYTPGRILKTIIAALVFNALPALCAYLLDTEGVAQYQYNAVWMVLTVPCTIIFWVAVGRIRVYNYPVFEQILPDGKTKSVKPDGAPNLSLFAVFKELREEIADDMSWVLLLVIGFFLFMFLGTLGAILMPD